MLRKLERDSLEADLAAVNALLAARTMDEDPVGYLQFAERKRELEQQLLGLAATPDDTLASVGLFFAGSPVFGAKGILASFAGEVLGAFQDLVSKRFAVLESGTLGSRGPVPLHADTNLMITDVARGSFGFVLHEAASNDSLADTALKQVMDDVASLVLRVAAQDDTVFEETADTLDPRMLGALKQFFRVLDEHGATLRLVEGERDESLDHDDVRRARARTEAIEIEESVVEDLHGLLLGVLPEHKRFELRRLDTGESLWGSISSDVAAAYQGSLAGEPIIGKPWRVRMKVRRILTPNRAPRFSYTLLGLLDPLPAAAAEAPVAPGTAGPPVAK